MVIQPNRNGIAFYAAGPEVDVGPQQLLRPAICEDVDATGPLSSVDADSVLAGLKAALCGGRPSGRVPDDGYDPVPKQEALSVVVGEGDYC